MIRFAPDDCKTIKAISAKRFAGVLFVCLCSIFLFGCNEIKAPDPRPYVGKIEPPKTREFRWSNGKMPKSFDPAKATAAPETDIVRAIYEGLTELDPKTLKTVSGVAERWSASEDFKTWTFHLRRDAKWSNGEAVTAKDFVRSWQRLTELGEKVSRRDLMKNIVGMNTEDILPIFAEESGTKENEELKSSGNTSVESSANSNTASANVLSNVSPVKNQNTNVAANTESQVKSVRNTVKTSAKFGVEAPDNYTLKVSLIQPDKDFPALVVHPIFRPVYGDGREFSALSAEIVTNGAFKTVEVGKTIVVEPSENYRNRSSIQIERIRFVPTENAETALAAYRAGEIDAVTNADLQPLALKLLTPFEKEFKQTKHGALNFYEFNFDNKPFDDLRVRQALTISIDRELLTDHETEGASKPALNFLPFDTNEKISEDAEKAKQLLADAGFPAGKNFPVIRLLINRNDLQRRVARAVAKMWKNVLNVETEIIVKDQADFENAFKNGEFDMVRRGVVFPTNDETVNMLTIFDLPEPEIARVNNRIKLISEPSALENKSAIPSAETIGADVAGKGEAENKKMPVLTEDEAVAAMPAIPLYFPTSYSLIKPYVQGFEMNELDSPSLQTITIDTDWKSEKNNLKESN